MARHTHTRRYRNYRSYDYGRERALQHIQEAKNLSRELGGTDKDVKDYFFSLSEQQLGRVLSEYEKAYGKGTREYAVSALPAWRSGKKVMSGLVASRLFNLLPPLMPFEKKYDLVVNLWKEAGPQSHTILRIGPDASIEDIVAKTREHLIETVKSYVIQDGLVQRFKWLTMGDVAVKQQLLNHLLDMEKQQAVELTRIQIPVMLDHIRNAAQHTHRLAQVLQIGKHKFEMLYDKNASGVTLEKPMQRKGNDTTGSNWVWILVALGILYFLAKHH